MSNFNISNIFDIQNQDDKPVDVYTLFNYNNNPSKEKIVLPKKESIDKAKLRITKENKINKVKLHYCKLYNELIVKINKEDDKGKNFLIYKVPPFMLSCFEYNYKDCTEYIKVNLEASSMDVLLLDNYTMFVSWKNIE